MNTMNSPAQRIGQMKGQFLKSAVPVDALGISGDQMEMKKNMGDTVIYRRWLPFGGAATNSTTINQWNVDPSLHLTQEGVTPEADQLAPQDITVTIRQYACLYMYTDRVAEMYEDAIPPAQIRQCGERMGLVKEMIRYGVLKSCSNKIYSGGTTRATVAAKISLVNLRLATETIRANRGNMVTQVLSAADKYDTSAVEQGYLVFVHTNCEHDIRETSGFVPVAKYGTMKTVHPNELGAIDRFRFIVSPELQPISGAGAAVGATGLKATGGQIDVYPYLIIAADAWADLALRGVNSMKPIHIDYKTESKDDPLNQRGYVGCKFYSAAFIQNDGWMVVIEAGSTDLAA